MLPQLFLQHVARKCAQTISAHWLLHYVTKFHDWIQFLCLEVLYFLYPKFEYFVVNIYVHWGKETCFKHKKLNFKRSQTFAVICHNKSWKCFTILWCTCSHSKWIKKQHIYIYISKHETQHKLCTTKCA